MLQVCPFDHPELLNQIARNASKDLEPQIEEKLSLAVSALPADHQPLVTNLVELLEQKTAVIQAQTARKMCSCRKCRTTR